MNASQYAFPQVTYQDFCKMVKLEDQIACLYGAEWIL